MGTRNKKSRDKKAGSRRAVQKNRETYLDEPWTSAVRNQDISVLRQVATEQGIPSKQNRAIGWPLLLGPNICYVEVDRYHEWSKASHRDSSTVRCDVDRSLHTFLKGPAAKKLNDRRSELHRLLNAVVNHQEGVYYYQGLHDVASVLLLVLGETAAFPLLCSLTTGHLRDCTRESIDAVLELLQLLQPILEAADPELAAHVRKLELAPYYALPWVLTWFAHDVTSLPQACRLFDLFLASHPLMPLYVGVSAMRCWRSNLLGCGGMAELHSALMNAWKNWPVDVEQVIQQALSLYGKLPPSRLHTLGPHPQLAVSHAAQLVDQHWEVPEKPPMPPPKGASGGGLSATVLVRLARRVGGSRGGAALAGAVLSVGGMSLLAVLVNTYMQQIPGRYGM